MNNYALSEEYWHHGLRYPLGLLEFLTSELQLGKRYVVLDVHTHNGQLTQLLHKHVHLMCSLAVDPGFHHFLKEQTELKNVLSMNGIPELTNIEEDSIHCLLIDETFERFDAMRMGIEFERILRLNSYVLILRHELNLTLGGFTSAYAKLLAVHEPQLALIQAPPNSQKLNTFYANGYQQHRIPNQQRLSWKELQQHLQALLHAASREGDEELWIALKTLFDTHQQEGKVIVEYQTLVTYGIFNHSVPEISLRKSIFFTLLRPFAFMFYVLVKANIYCWKLLYKAKDKLFGKKE